MQFYTFPTFLSQNIVLSHRSFLRLCEQQIVFFFCFFFVLFFLFFLFFFMYTFALFCPRPVVMRKRNTASTKIGTIFSSKAVTPLFYFFYNWD